MSAYDTRFFFRLWEVQEEQIYRYYLQFASYCTREGKSTTSMKDGSGDASEGVVALFPEIGKDTTDGYKSPRT
jgi:hypothetical protein